MAYSFVISNFQSYASQNGVHMREHLWVRNFFFIDLLGRRLVSFKVISRINKKHKQRINLQQAEVASKKWNSMEIRNNDHELYTNKYQSLWTMNELNAEVNCIRKLHFFVLLFANAKLVFMRILN